MQRWASVLGIECKLRRPDVLAELRRHWLPVSIPPGQRSAQFSDVVFRAMLESQTYLCPASLLVGRSEVRLRH